MSHNILVIGSSNTDMVVQVPNLPAAGETILGGVFQQASGGKGANQAVAAKRCGGQVALLACVGDDSLGEAVLKAYQADGIDVSAVVVDPKAKSGVAIIMVNKDGENSIAVASGANDCLTVEHIEKNKALIEQAKVILFQLETPLPTIEKAIALAAAANKIIILNPAPAQALSDRLLSQISLLTPNETEASLLTGIAVCDATSAKKAAQCLLLKGVQQVIITMGELGVFYMDAKQAQMFPAFNVKATDSTAAGDTFNGALAAVLANQEEIFSCIHFAQAAAALSVQKSGAQPSIPCKQEVMDFLASRPLTS
jgi:ribokinase